MDDKRIADFLCRLSEKHFVLHGSPTLCTALEPRQASGYSDELKQNLCAIYATTIIEIALLKSMVVDPSGTWGWQHDYGWFSWRRTPILNVYGARRLKPGYIYILDQDLFEPITEFTYVSFAPVVPLMVLETRMSMLDQFDRISFK